ncbi:hypothetical protein KSF_034290 [Reticulibacter mediterranei]|uniref:non-specific serine/threonine protein kinase n=1 Tax=Reticulibacter mediterranei TaxID=2778369 RepID=A0A8J3IQ57_9CHLR|nr:serine/threonine-protein kinase [Reticulibacter mediterranei]GHO93381.1 hypothetical protein KSF_034290 [Reticulibacter mediterranei]
MVDSREERIGQQCNGYRLTRLLGRGTYGTVYLAEHVSNFSLAAVKVLGLPLTGRDHGSAFINEARMIRLQHPHIVPILDFGVMRSDGLPFLIMDYATGGTLRACYPKGTKLPWPVIDNYVQAIGSALQYAHEHNIIHRDVKPENILICGDGRVQLSDFGIARIVEQNTASMGSHSPVGTPAYMAPEQSQGKACYASDQYALAIVVYEWLAGRRPFQGSYVEVAVQHRMDSPPRLCELCPEVSLQIEQVVFKALAKGPEDRFPSVRDFAQALHNALQEAMAASPSMQQIREYNTVPGFVELSPPQTDRLAETVTPNKSKRPVLPADEWSSSKWQSIPTVPASRTALSMEQGLSAKPSLARATLGKTRRISPVMLLSVLLVVVALGPLLMVFRPSFLSELLPAKQATQPPGQQTRSSQNTPQSTPAPDPTPLPQTPQSTPAPDPTPLSQTPQQIYQQFTAGTPTKRDMKLDGTVWPWFNAAPTFGSCAFMQDAYHVTTHAGSFASCIASNDQYTTFAFQAQVSIQSGDAGGLIIDYQPTTPYRTYDAFLFCRDTGAKYCKTGNVWLTHAEHGGAGCMTSATFNCDQIYPFVKADLGVENTLTIIALSHTIYLYINGQSVGVVPRLSLTSGGIGVVAFEEAISTDVVFSDAKLWVLSGV